MATSSASAGFLAPISSSDYDDALDDTLQATIVGITGIPGKLVRPRWQPTPPVQPGFDESWCAFGVSRRSVDAFAHEGHDPSNATSTLERDELLMVLHSFYGPAAHGLCERFRDGLDLAQNRDALSSAGIGLVDVEEAISVPSLMHERWVKRVDITVVYRRRTARSFSIETVQSADNTLDNEQYTTPIN